MIHTHSSDMSLRLEYSIADDLPACFSTVDGYPNPERARDERRSGEHRSPDSLQSTFQRYKPGMRRSLLPILIDVTHRDCLDSLMPSSGMRIIFPEMYSVRLSRFLSARDIARAQHSCFSAIVCMIDSRSCCFGNWRVDSFRGGYSSAHRRALESHANPAHQREVSTKKS